jgi:hypothetical protein
MSNSVFGDTLRFSANPTSLQQNYGYAPNIRKNPQERLLAGFLLGD